MTTVLKAIVRNGRLELEQPLDLPDGTEFLVPVPGESPEATDDNWSNSPEAVADWLRWYDSLEPLVLSAEEEEDTQSWLKQLNDRSAERLQSSVEDLF